MAKFILLYNGPATSMDDMSQEQTKSIQQGWENWIDKNGDGIIDVGAPMFNGVSIVDDGSDGSPSMLSGYTIIEALDIPAARQIVEGHPFLSEGSGKFSIEIHELSLPPF